MSRGVSGRNVTRVTSWWSSSHAGESRQRPETTSCVLPPSASSISAACSALPPSRRPGRRRRPWCRRRAPAGRRPPRRPSAPSRARARGRARPGRRRAGRAPRSRGATTSNGRPSCSRIARRCGEVEASRSGGAGATLTPRSGAGKAGASRSLEPPSSLRLTTLPDLPDLLHRPRARPLRLGRAAVGRLGSFRRLHLDQVLDLEPVRAEEPDPLAVRQVELDGLVRPSSKRCMPKYVRVQPRRRSSSVCVVQQTTRAASSARTRTGRRAAAAAPPRGRCRYGSAKVIAPWSQKTTSKLASGSGTSLRARVHEREVDAGLGHQLARVLELPRRVVQPDQHARRARRAGSTTARRRSRARARPCRRRRRGPAARTRGAATCPSAARRGR